MDLDWRWLRSFVAVADATTMQEAAAETGISQPTLSRHLKQLESALDMTLFERAGPNLVLSSKGHILYEQAVHVRDAVAGFERRAMGESEEATGTVRVTMYCMLGYHYAPLWLKDLRAKHPHVSVDLVVDTDVNLLLREADIATLISKPTQLDLITQRVGQLMMGVYASDTYLAEHEAGSLQDLLSHEIIGFDRLTQFIDQARALGFEMEREDFATRTDDYAVHAMLIKEGFGIGVIPIQIAEAMGLTRVFPELTIPGEELYLAAHPDLHRNPRVSIVWNHLREALQASFG